LNPRRPKPHSATIIDLAEARKRREEASGIERGEAMSFISFSFDHQVSYAHEQVEMVIDREEGVGLAMRPSDALRLAKALRAAALRGRKRGAGFQPIRGALKRLVERSLVEE
jgi:hypothetical protein